MWSLGCEKFLSSPAWLLLIKTGPPFSSSLYKNYGKYLYLLAATSASTP